LDPVRHSGRGWRATLGTRMARAYPAWPRQTRTRHRRGSGNGGGQCRSRRRTRRWTNVWLPVSQSADKTQRRNNDMGAAITGLFDELASQATLPARSIATAVIIAIGLTLTLMPWESGAVRFLKDSALRVAVGLAIVLNAAAIVATMSGR